MKQSSYYISSTNLNSSSHEYAMSTKEHGMTLWLNNYEHFGK